MASRLPGNETKALKSIDPTCAITFESLQQFKQDLEGRIERLNAKYPAKEDPLSVVPRSSLAPMPRATILTTEVLQKISELLKTGPTGSVSMSAGLF